MKRDAWLLILIPALLGACGPKEGSQASDSGSSSTSGVMSGTTSEALPTGTTGEVSTTGTTSQPTTEPMGTSFDPNTCGAVSVVHRSNVMLVLDKSGSMVAEPGGFWDHDQDPNTPEVTRWSSLHTAVAGFVEDTDLALNLGLVLFPSKGASGLYDETACIVDAEAAAPIAGMNAGNILAALPGALTDATQIKGATPTTAGLQVAIQAFEGVPVELPRFIILVTDGAANCQADAPDSEVLFEDYDDEVVTTVAAAAAMGIKTFVVGIDVINEVSSSDKDGDPDEVNSYEQLNELALAGGVARPGDEKFFNATDQSGLQAALDEILGQISICVIALEPTPKYPGWVEVAPYGDHQVADCMTEDGWTFLPKLDPDDPHELLRIELCGAACSDYRMNGEVEVKYGCHAE